MTDVISPIGLIHEHPSNKDLVLTWEGGQSICADCGIPVELVMIEYRVSQYVLSRPERTHD